MELTPTKDEMRKWLLDTIRHVSHIEYFLSHLKLGGNDPERPHDLVGPGNKFEWDVIKGLALQYREPKVNFETHIQPALDLHRQQHHHMMWNNPAPGDIMRPVPEATASDMLVGAVDTNCSLLESRMYQGGTHEYSKIREIAEENPPHKTPWMLALIPLMQGIEQPNLKSISNILEIPNVGLPEHIYGRIVRRTWEVLGMLGDKGYDFR